MKLELRHCAGACHKGKDKDKRGKEFFHVCFDDELMSLKTLHVQTLPVETRHETTLHA